MPIASIVATMNASAIRALQQGDNLSAVARLRRTLTNVQKKCHARDARRQQQQKQQSSLFLFQEGTSSSSSNNHMEISHVPLHCQHEQQQQQQREEMIRPVPVVFPQQEQHPELMQTVTLPPLVELDASCPSDAIYNRAFGIPNCNARGNPHVSMECISAVLLYNISVALHRDALQCQNHSKTSNNNSKKDEALGRALHMYRQAHAVLEKINLVEYPGLVNVLAAVYFNMQQIYATLHQVEACRTLRNRLTQLFAWGGAVVLGEADYAFYHFQMWVAWVDNFRLAAAA